jgi:hypothetical protein
MHRPLVGHFLLALAAVQCTFAFCPSRLVNPHAPTLSLRYGSTSIATCRMQMDDKEDSNELPSPGVSRRAFGTGLASVSVFLARLVIILFFISVLNCDMLVFPEHPFSRQNYIKALSRMPSCEHFACCYPCSSWIPTSMAGGSLRAISLQVSCTRPPHMLGLSHSHTSLYMRIFSG